MHLKTHPKALGVYETLSDWVFFNQWSCSIESLCDKAMVLF